MATTLQVGVGRQLCLDDDASPAAPDPGVVVASDADSVAAMAAAALRQPIGFPPLTSCVVPDDHVAIALGAGIPAVAEVVRGTLDALQEAGIAPSRVVIVSAEAEDTAFLKATLASDGFGEVAFETHDPTDEQTLCFAGVTASEQPLLLNRRLVEADVALPITCAKATAGDVALGAFAGFYPAFSDLSSRQAASNLTPRNERFATPADEAGWLLGAAMVVQVAPSRSGGVEGVFAGTAESVTAAAGPVAQRLWKQSLSGRSELAIATLTGDGRQQTWANVSRAIDVVEPLLAGGGAIALCTEIDEPLDAGFAELLATGDAERAFLEMEGDSSPTAEVVRRLVAATERGPVYLMSGLDAEWVEDIGLAPIASEAELRRLVQQRPRHVVVEGAQHAAIEVVDTNANEAR